MFQLTPTVRNLLIANVVVFFISWKVASLDFLALYVIGSPLFQPWQFLTYMFMHADIGHIFSNMLGLIVFGPMLEQRWGARRFLTFWLICGLGAAVLYNGLRTYEVRQMHEKLEVFRQEPTGVNLMDFVDDVIPDQHDTYLPSAQALHDNPNNTYVINNALGQFDRLYNGSVNGAMVGASGALFGIMLAFAFYFPNTPLMIFPLPFPIKAKYFVVLYGLFEFYSGIRRAPGDNVAHFAHLGGLLVGLVLVLLWQRNRTRMY